MFAIRRCVWVPMLAALLWLGLTTAASSAPRSQRCNRHGAEAIQKTSTVLVYTSDGEVFMACMRPGGKPVHVLPPPGAPSIGPAGAEEDFAIAGTFVAAEWDDAPYVMECFKHATSPNPNCPPEADYVSVVELKSGRSVSVSTPSRATELAVSPRGAVAWVQPGNGYSLMATVLHKRGRSGFAARPKQIDSGNSFISSVRFTGLTLRWKRNGRAYQKTLS